MAFFRTKISSFALVIFALMAVAGIAYAGAVVTGTAAYWAERGINDCGDKFAGQSANLNRCISDELQKMTSTIRGRSDVNSLAPQAIPTVNSSASKLRRQKSKRGALAVLNQARRILRDLTAKSSGEARQVYDRLQRVFTVAITVVTSKG